MNKYYTLKLRQEGLTANLNELSLQGWDFVAWVDSDWRHMLDGSLEREALFRQPDQPDV